MNMLEKKKHYKPYFCKRLFKLVFVLFKLQKEVPIEKIRDQIQLHEDNPDDESAANSSMLEGTPSQCTLDNDKRSHSAGVFKESTYSTFKATHANMFSINYSSKGLLSEKRSLSPRTKEQAMHDSIETNGSNKNFKTASNAIR